MAAAGFFAVAAQGCGSEDLRPSPDPGDGMRQGTITPPGRVFADNPRTHLDPGETHRYDLALEAGERIDAALHTACDGLSASLFLFGPAPERARLQSAQTTELSCGVARIRPFEAPTRGRYLLLIRADHGSGPYQLDVGCTGCAPGNPWTEARDQTEGYQDMAGGDLSAIGEAIFEHVHQLPEGLGRYDERRDLPPPAFNLVHDGPKGGPDGQSCVQCHNVGEHGAGSLDENIYQGGDGENLDMSFHRNPPALRGLGLRQAIAAELSAALTAQLDVLRAAAEDRGTPQAQALCVPSLDDEPVCFATPTVEPGGNVSGFDDRVSYDADAGVVVQPFGWKGRDATLQSFIGGGLRVHFGLQLEAPIAAYCALEAPTPEQVHVFETKWGKGPCPDPDQDGVVAEVSDGQLAALAVYMLKIRPPAPAPADHPGRAAFRDAGCTNCHTRAFPLASDIDRSLGLDVALPSPAGDIELWSDFRRHPMGYDNGDYHVFSDDPAPINPYWFVTPPLWDVASTAPYMHDGRAETLEDAIFAHDHADPENKAAQSVQRFRELTSEQRKALLDFLGQLGRQYVSAP